ncbi:HpcH/HpaI aldolase family protein [Diaminobutyricibacter sp. McL0618]|uniref:HpcH/HpaI aldolase family protein n=1 Tax=Leifsonia sp. McL0618 TaxID=3415677 RepID=UPI003CE7F79D
MQSSPTAPLLQALHLGEPQLMFGIRMSRSTDAVRIAASTGHHCVMIDLEHSTMSTDTAATLAAAAHDLGLTSLVRVPEREYGMIGRLLDGGADGIIAPRVETADDARTLVDACRFPPRGHRSAVTQLPQRGMTPASAADLNPATDASTIVKVLIESPRGVANMAEIAAVAGVDIVGIGANDLSAELGIPGDYDDPRIAAAVAELVTAVHAEGTLGMIGGVPPGPAMRRFLQAGLCPLVLTGTDSGFLYSAASTRAAEWLAAATPE